MELEKSGMHVRYEGEFEEREEPPIVRAVTVHKYNYERPPYENTEYGQPEPPPTVRTQQQRSHFKQSEVQTRTGYDDNSMDFPRTERSALKSARSGLL